MTLHDFNKLDGAGKLITVWMHGTFIESHRAENEKYKLYSLDRFYVEIKFGQPENIIIEVSRNDNILESIFNNTKLILLSKNKDTFVTFFLSKTAFFSID